MAVATCMLMAPAAETRSRAPAWLSPVLAYGRRSYEVYLIHMFVVFGCFDLFMASGHPMWMVPVLFIVAIVLSGLLGELVGRFFSEPANRWIRARLGDGPGKVRWVSDRS